MIDWDNGPGAMLIWVLVVYTFPFIYSFFVDHFDKNKPPIDTYSK
jgi:cytochrome c biogenesis factor